MEILSESVNQLGQKLLAVISWTCIATRRPVYLLDKGEIQCFDKMHFPEADTWHDSMVAYDSQQVSWLTARACIALQLQSRTRLTIGTM